MLTREENELVTRISAGTPMGETMRRYWIPALLARELPEPDCPPVRVKLLGEELVAFRDTEGRVGLLDEYCPHRRASLFFGRNEECGLRCVYHGWKFDVSGRCVDMMNEPEELSFKHKIRQQSYPTVELGGLIWAYMGPPDQEPPLPKFAWTQSAPNRGVQLAPGARGRHRHLARADPAPAHHDQLQPAGHQPQESVRSRQGARARRRPDGLGLPLRRHPAARRERHAHPHLSLRPAVPPDPPLPDERGRRRGGRAHLGADG
ncbi:MAG: hypothetical protein DME05_09330 [Candidatus Rokuibacteriota bacterium]|nr:MAG: hypothetical protein DME05_09330 [Candidatus Rokubacteria bacterium]